MIVDPKILLVKIVQTLKSCWQVAKRPFQKEICTRYDRQQLKYLKMETADSQNKDSRRKSERTNGKKNGRLRSNDKNEGLEKE